MLAPLVAPWTTNIVGKPVAALTPPTPEELAAARALLAELDSHQALEEIRSAERGRDGARARLERSRP